MNRRRLAALLLLTGCGAGAEPAADLVIRNAAIFSGDPVASPGTASGSVAIRDGRIVFAGPDSGIRRHIGTSTEVVDGRGRMLLPGFVDSHVHPYSGVELGECDLSRDSTPQQALATVGECARARPDAPWVRGTGWALPMFPAANPKATLLDQAVANRPVFLTAADGHSAWINSKAIQLAGLGRETRDPPGGRIERDATGAPTGALRESAMRLVERLLPEYTTDDYIEGFDRAFALASSFGITALIDANGDSAMLDAYRLMDSLGRLPVRITVAQQLDLDAGPPDVEGLVRVRDRFRGERLSANSAKIFLDGVIEARSAALLEPYLGSPGSRGEPTLPQEELDDLVARLDRAGIQVHVHAIGDRAIRMALDAFARARSVNGIRDSRHQIAHLELIDPGDIPRFKALRVIANFQPFWASADPYITELTIPVLGPARSRWLYPIQSMIQSGATVVAGSDWSVSTMNPLEAIQVAMTRRGLDEGRGTAWIPEERAGLQALLLAYTINGAHARFADSLTGSVSVGKLADLVLLERDLFMVAPEAVGGTRVLMTIAGGRVVYRGQGR